MNDLISIEQHDDGTWHALDTDHASAPVDGWPSVARLLGPGEGDATKAAWRTTADLSRFRAEYGEPPAELGDRLALVPVD